MKAVVQTAIGQPAEALKLIEFDDIEPKPGEVLVKLSLAPVHHGDILQIQGQQSIPEAVGYVPRGTEAVGIVGALGADVEREGRLKVGDRVIAFPASGTWAGRFVIPASAAIPVPTDIADEVAAQLFVNYAAARIIIRGLQASVSNEALRAGAILVTGASTVVARLLLHLLKKEGFTPLGLARSARAAERVASEIDGVPVAATENPDWSSRIKASADGRPIVGVLDCVAGSLVAELLPLVADGAAFVTYGALGGFQPTFGPVELISRHLIARGVTFDQWFGGLAQDEREQDIEAAFGLARELPAVFKVSSVRGLADIASSIRDVEAPGRNGFVLVRP